MVSKNPFLISLIRICLLIITAFLLPFAMQEKDYLFLVPLLLVFMGLLFYFLIRDHKTINRVHQASRQLHHQDSEATAQSTDHYPSDFKSETELNDGEFQYLYLLNIISHIRIGIMVFESNGRIDMINETARKLLGIDKVRFIRDLSQIEPELPNIVFNLKPGESRLLKLLIRNEPSQLAFQADQFKLYERTYTLISLQNLQNALDENEMLSWQKLIRVITHEIMNSITPISSLASTAKSLLVDKKGKILSHEKIDEETISDIADSLLTIEKRSEGLLNFVKTYRNLTGIPKPNFQLVTAASIFKRVEQLMQHEIEKSKIQLKIKPPSADLKITADANLIEQVLINLLMNAVDAVKKVKRPVIELEGDENETGRLIIKVSDNGVGIKEDVMDRIFVPFYTSKKEGTGIGLSLSRFIMLLHKGTINVQSIPGERTTFTLNF